MTTIVMTERDQKIADLRRLSAELGAPTMPDLHIAAKVTDRDGNVLEDRYEQGHSWTRNAWSAFHFVMLNAASPTAASGAGNSSYSRGNMGLRNYVGNFNAGYENMVLPYKIASTSSDIGLVIGTSSEAFTSEDFCLFGHISAGTSTGQLSYLTMTWTEPVLNTGTNTFSTTCTRVFNNNSTAAIVVREVGLIGSGYLMSRDVLSSPVNVPVGAQLTMSVVVTSGSWSALDATSVPAQPATGTLTQGGIYLGTNFSESLGWIAPNNHLKYGLVVSPIAGESTALAWRTTTAATLGCADFKDGGKNMAALYALGTASPVGRFAADANSANLGGYNDWYVPSNYEMYWALYNARASVTGVNALSDIEYWTSTISGDGGPGTYPAWVNPTTQTTGSTANMTETRKVRLVRRASLV